MKLETGIQTAILNYLSYYENQGKLYCFRSNSFGGFIQRSNGTRGYIKNNKRGLPDIVCCISGRFLALEIKTDKGKQSEFQKAAQTAIEKSGGLYSIVRSVDDVEKIIKSLTL